MLGGHNLLLLNWAPLNIKALSPRYHHQVHALSDEICFFLLNHNDIIIVLCIDLSNHYDIQWDQYRPLVGPISQWSYSIPLWSIFHVFCSLFNYSPANRHVPVWRNGNCFWINSSQLLQRFSLDISHCNALDIDIHHWYLTNFPLWLVVSTVNLYIYIFPQTWVHYECHYLRHGLNSVGKIIKYHPCLD